MSIDGPGQLAAGFVLADEGLEGGAKRVLAVHQAQFAAITVMAPSYGIAPGDPDLHVMTGKIGSTHGNSCPSRDDSRKREAAGRRDLQHYFFLPGFAEGEVERRNPEGGEKSVCLLPQPRELPAAAIAITSLRISWRMTGGESSRTPRRAPARRRRSTRYSITWSAPVPVALVGARDRQAPPHRGSLTT